MGQFDFFFIYFHFILFFPLWLWCLPIGGDKVEVSGMVVR
jgi:hypothetical protein